MPIRMDSRHPDVPVLLVHLDDGGVTLCRGLKHPQIATSAWPTMPRLLCPLCGSIWDESAVTIEPIKGTVWYASPGC